MIRDLTREFMTKGSLRYPVKVFHEAFQYKYHRIFPTMKYLCIAINVLTRKWKDEAW